MGHNNGHNDIYNLIQNSKQLTKFKMADISRTGHLKLKTSEISARRILITYKMADIYEMENDVADAEKKWKLWQSMLNS